jgi:hypothetical protein
MVRVDEPDPVMDAELNPAVAPPRPTTVKPPTVPTKLFTPAALTEYVALAPGRIVEEAGVTTRA